MKRTICVISILILSIGLFAQEEEKLLEYCRNFSYQEIENGLNDLQGKSTEKIAYVWHIELERELINDFFEQIISFTKKVQDKDNLSMHTIFIHKIKLIKTKIGHVAFYKVVKLKNVRSKRKWIPTEMVLKEDSNNSLKQLEMDFRTAYSKSLNYKELFVTDIVFGKMCGIGAMKPTYRVGMEKLVESKDTTTLIKWLRSTNIEIQLYAIDGILTLRQEGINFDHSILDLIDLIEKKEGSAFTCSGCSHWYQPIGDTAVRIKREHNWT